MPVLICPTHGLLYWPKTAKACALCGVPLQPFKNEFEAALSLPPAEPMPAAPERKPFPTSLFP